MRAMSSGTGGTGCCRRSDMDDLRTRDPSNARALHTAADFANDVRSFSGRHEHAEQKPQETGGKWSRPASRWALSAAPASGVLVFVGPHRPDCEKDEDEKKKPVHNSAPRNDRADGTIASSSSE